MKLNLRLLARSALLSCVAALSIATASAQPSTWIGPATGGEWNTDANWSTGLTPGVGTNAMIDVATSVSYNVPMTAASFGALTNRGALNINALGFNSGPIIMTNIGARLFVNNGGALNVTGDFAVCSNASGSMSIGSSVTVSGRLMIGSGDDGGTGNTADVHCFGSFTNFGGTLNAGATLLNPGNGSINTTCRLLILGGMNNFGALTVNRAPGGASATPVYGSDGVTISNGTITATSITLGNNAHGLIYMLDGTFTNAGMFTVRNNTTTRPARFVQRGGFFSTAAGTNYVVMTGFGSAGNGDTVYAVLGGTNSIGGVQFGVITNFVQLITNLDLSVTTNIFSGPTGGVGFFTNSATINIGSAGFTSNGVTTISLLLNTGGRFFSSTDWTNAVPITLAGGTFEAQDINGNPHNIYSSGILRGNGTLIKNGAGTMSLAASNINSGQTLINAGKLALVNDGVTTFGSLLVSTLINVGTGATFDVSQAPNFVLGNSKTIAGVGTVLGSFAASGGSIISPAGGSVEGTLTFANGLTATNSILSYDLTDDPTGVSKVNDAINITGDLTVSGTNTFSVTPANGSLGIGTYSLIKYSGNLNGGITNFACISGTLTNPPGEIDLVVSTLRPSASLIWRGDGSGNVWDSGVSSNWLNGVARDRFFTGDTNRFDDSSTNFTVNLSGIVLPAVSTVVLVNATNDYTFTGSGTISGTTGLTKTNSGRLNMGVTNGYTGITTISGGILSAPALGNGGVSGPIGAAPNSAANIVINSGTLEYTGPNVTSDRGMTFTNNGGSISVSNVTLTLSGTLTGPGSLTKIGNGQLSLPNANDLVGGVVINSGTVRAAQGSGAFLTCLGTNILTLSGSNSVAAFLFGGDAEVLDNTLNVLGTQNYITNNGNETISNMIGNGTVYLEEVFNPAATNVTTNVTTLGASSPGFTGSIVLNSLVNIRLLGASGLDFSGAEIDLGTGIGFLNNRNGNYTASIGAISGGPYTRISGSATVDSPPTTYIIGGKNIDTSYSGQIYELSPNRKVNIVKTGTGTWTLFGGIVTNIIDISGGFGVFVTNNVATNQLRYTGSTTISNGVLALVAPNVLSSSTNITLASATAVFNALQMGFVDPTDPAETNVITDGNLTIVPAQTLAGIGTILASNVYVPQFTQFMPGLPYGTLMVSSNIELGGSVTMNVNPTTIPNCSTLAASQIVVDPSATLTVLNLGPEAGGTFQLFNHPVNFASVSLPGLSGTNIWINNLTVDGSITLAAPPFTGGPSTTPVSLLRTFSGGNLTLTWPTDHTGWRLQSQTNTVRVGLNTNWADVGGSTSTNQVTVPVTPANGTVFFRLTYP